VNDETSNPWYLPNAVVSRPKKQKKKKNKGINHFFSEPGCSLLLVKDRREQTKRQCIMGRSSHAMIVKDQNQESKLKTR